MNWNVNIHPDCEPLQCARKKDLWSPNMKHVQCNMPDAPGCPDTSTHILPSQHTSLAILTHNPLQIRHVRGDVSGEHKQLRAQTFASWLTGWHTTARSGVRTFSLTLRLRQIKRPRGQSVVLYTASSAAPPAATSVFTCQSSVLWLIVNATEA